MKKTNEYENAQAFDVAIEKLRELQGSISNRIAVTGPCVEGTQKIS